LKSLKKITLKTAAEFVAVLLASEVTHLNNFQGFANGYLGTNVINLALRCHLR
jgi:hypothetical protein